MKKVTVDYNGIEFELDGYYQEGEKRTHDYPGCGSVYEIYNAFVNGIDIMEILVESQLEDLQYLAIEQIED